ncbi:hypothetical protein, partial [Paramagnetospirillum marisnigri]|uniref:hypothetical protein n=1 Tax=Paramagnetospirillum marisnigri TaxID=1285242 RepID=UPI001C12AD6D
GSCGVRGGPTSHTCCHLCCHNLTPLGKRQILTCVVAQIRLLDNSLQADNNASSARDVNNHSHVRTFAVSTSCCFVQEFDGAIVFAKVMARRFRASGCSMIKAPDMT